MRIPALSRRVRLATVLAAALLPACGGGGGTGAPAPTTGSLLVKMHDCPISGVDNVSHVYVTIESVEVSRMENDVEVKETVASVPGQYDLLDLQHGVEAVLGSGEFPAGDYKWIRLMVAGDSKHDIRTLPAEELQNYIVVEDTPYPLVVPSGTRTGIKLGHSFTIPAGGATTLTLDFDLRKSVHRAGHRRNHVYRLRPRIRVVPVTSDGSAGVEGDVTTSDGSGLPSGTVVSAQRDGDEAASSEVDGEGHYAIAGLADGTYDLVVIAPGYDYKVESGVVVTGGSAAESHDLAVSPASVGSIYGTVTPAGDVTVRLLIAGGLVVGSVAADPVTGDYGFDNVPAGSYTVEATDGTNTTSATPTVTGGAGTQQDLSL